MRTLFTSSGPTGKYQKKRVGGAVSLRGTTILIANTTKFVNSGLTGRLLSSVRKVRIVNFSGMGSCCSIHLGRCHLGRLSRCRKFAFVGTSLTSGSTMGSMFRRCHPAIIIGLTTRTNIQCSVARPSTCVRSGLVNFCGVLRTYHRRPISRLICTSDSSMCKSGGGIPCSASSGMSGPIDLCTTAGGSSRLLTRTCSGLCSVPSANLHFFAICKPTKHPSVTCFNFAGGLHTKRAVGVFGCNGYQHSFACISSVIRNVLHIVRNTPSGRAKRSNLPIPPCTICGVNGKRPRGLLRFIAVLRRRLLQTGILPTSCSFRSRGRLIPVRPNSIPIACTSATTLRHSFNCGPSAPLHRNLHQFTR